MPTIPGIPGPYRLYFYSFDCNEPPHVHVQRERATAKFWLTPVALAGSHGLRAQPPRPHRCAAGYLGASFPHPGGLA